MVAGRKCGHVSLSNEQGMNHDTRCFNPCSALCCTENADFQLKCLNKNAIPHTALLFTGSRMEITVTCIPLVSGYVHPPQLGLPEVGEVNISCNPAGPHLVCVLPPALSTSYCIPAAWLPYIYFFERLPYFAYMSCRVRFGMGEMPFVQTFLWNDFLVPWSHVRLYIIHWLVELGSPDTEKFVSDLFCRLCGYG